jgi:uncharacterized iron-regulated protein
MRLVRMRPLLAATALAAGGARPAAETVDAAAVPTTYADIAQARIP